MSRIMQEIKLDAKGLIPAIVQDHKNGQILMFAYLNKEAIQKTLATGLMHYFSRSRKKLWLKGEESGHHQVVHDVYLDCDADCLLFTVDQTKAACHAGYRSCFFRKVNGSEWQIVLKKIFDPQQVYIKRSGIVKKRL